MKNQFYLNYVVFLAGIISAVSCSTKNANSSTSEGDNYQFVKIDSFQVSNLTRISILDYSTEEKIYLGYSLNENDILEISKGGEILKRTNKTGDGPGNYGNWNPMGLGFGPASQRIVELPFQVISYDKNYQVVYDHRIASPLPIKTSTPLGKPPYYLHNDTTLLLIGPSNYLTATYLIQNQLAKDTLQNFYQLNLQTGSVKSIVPYEGTSIYNSTENIYPELMGKSFFIDNEKNELVLAQNLDSEILIYSLPDLSLKQTIPITYSEFQTYSPVPIGTQFPDPNVLQLSRLSARNQKLLNLGDNIYALQYFTGISQAEYDSRNSEDEHYIGQFDETEQRILIFKNGKQASKELVGINGSLILSLPDNKILVQERETTEFEEEFTRFTIYQLQTN